MKTFAVTLLGALLSESTNAWWGQGHLIVARGAEEILQKENPEALSKALTQLEALKKDFPDLTKDEGDHPFVECATFADDIKGEGYSFQSPWHFIDQPYLDEGGKIGDYDFTPDTYFVTDALTALTAWLRKDGDYTSSYYYKTVNDHFSDSADAESFALRLIIHYVGDVHQPLHATSEVDHTYPEGDFGGNKEYLPYVDGAGNLHSVWDSVIYEHTGYPDLPLNDADWNALNKDVSQIQSEHPIPQKDYHDHQPQQWAEESFNDAVQIVYPDVVVHEALSDEYIAKALPIAQERLAYGGRRLADLIAYIYNESEITSESAFLQ